MPVTFMNGSSRVTIAARIIECHRICHSSIELISQHRSANGSFEVALANLRTRQKGRPSTVTVHRRIATMNNKTMGLDQTEEDLLISGISDETFIQAAF